MDSGQTNGDTENKVESLEDWMKRIDEKIPSPNVRASRVNAALMSAGDFTPWDLCCFGAETCGAMALALDDEEFTEAAKKLLNRLYTLHYNGMPQALGEKL